MKYGVIFLCFLLGCAHAQAAPQSSPEALNQLVLSLAGSFLKPNLGASKANVSNPLEQLKTEVGNALLNEGLNLYNEFSRGEGIIYQNKDVLAEIFNAGQSIITNYLSADEKVRADMVRGLLLDVLSAVGITSFEPVLFDQMAEDTAVEIARFLVKEARSLLGETADNETSEEDRADFFNLDTGSILGGLAVFLQSFAESFGQQS